MSSKPLPKIMYDQTQYTPQYMIGRDALWINEESYFAMEKMSGYTPNPWYLYTQNKPVSFFFGAYPEEVLNKEAEVGLKNFTDPEYVKNFENAVQELYEKTKDKRDVFFSKFHEKEKEMLQNNPEDVVSFLNEIKALNIFIMSYYFQTQPQRFYKIEKRLKNTGMGNDLEVLSTNGRHLTYIAQLNYTITHTAQEIVDQETTAPEYKKDNPDKWKDIESKINQLGFLNWGLLGGDLVDVNNLEKKIQELANNPDTLEKEKQQVDELLNNLKKRNQILKKESEDVYHLADLAGHASVMRFDLQTCTLALLRYTEQIFTALKEIKEISDDELAAYEYSDIVKLIKEGRKLPEEEIKKRWKGCLRILRSNGEQTFHGEEAHENIKDLLEHRQKEIEESKELNGIVASWPDKSVENLEAKVFVLTTAFGADKVIKEFQEGDILVTTQTHPNIVPAMKKARAIITDEGGITCHAAIVSRELGKPCIIGTRLATKTLQTGNIVQMNLKEGVIKKK